MKEVRIPEERVAILIGENGETKEDIEDLTDCELTIQDNLAKIEGDPLDEMDAQNMVKAIGRGFNPDKAARLAERDVMFHMIDINNFASTENSRDRLKGRVIGRDGEISVYGKTIGIIGVAQNIEIISEVIKQLLNGRSHSSAYNYLEKNQAKIKR